MIENWKGVSRFLLQRYNIWRGWFGVDRSYSWLIVLNLFWISRRVDFDTELMAHPLYNVGRNAAFSWRITHLRQCLLMRFKPAGESFEAYASIFGHLCLGSWFHFYSAFSWRIKLELKVNWGWIRCGFRLISQRMWRWWLKNSELKYK